MVPASSHEIPRVSWYSGFCLLSSPFVYRALTFFGRLFQNRSTGIFSLYAVLTPGCTHPGLGSSDFARHYFRNQCLFLFLELLRCFSSLRFPSHTLCIHHTMTEVSSAGFPHSDIRGSRDMCSSPRLFAAYHVFLRLSVPRHPSCALLRFTF